MERLESAKNEEIKIPRVVEVTQNNVQREYLELVADAAIGRIVKANGGDIDQVQPTAAHIIESIHKSVAAILDGRAVFTAYASYDGRLHRFAMSSLSRPKLYIVEENFCECESHLHNGYCVHRTTRQLIADYFTLIRADEERMRKYATLGIKVTTINDIHYPSGVQYGVNSERIPAELQQLISEVERVSGMRIGDMRLRVIPLGPGSLRPGV